MKKRTLRVPKLMNTSPISPPYLPIYLPYISPISRALRMPIVMKAFGSIRKYFQRVVT